MGEKPLEVIEICAASAKSFQVQRGQLLRIIDIEGKQVGDFICFNLHTLSDKFSAGRTRRNNGKLRVTKGDHLFSNLCNVMFTIEEDTCGVHDLLCPSCCRWVFENIYKVAPKTGCFEHLALSLRPYGIGEQDIPDPFNIFMRTHVVASNRLEIEEPSSKAGDYIDLRAEMDCLVAISSCAVDCGPVNAFKLKPLLVKIYQF
jgi:uncharacterized protein YcgI (DUF1989 family)